MAARRDACRRECGLVETSNLVDGVERPDAVRDIIQRVAFLRGDGRHVFLGLLVAPFARRRASFCVSAGLCLCLRQVQMTFVCALVKSA